MSEPRHSHTFTMPAGVGQSDVHDCGHVKNKSLRLYSADWTGILDVEARYESEAWHVVYDNVTFTAGGSVDLGMGHEYKDVRINVTGHTSGAVPTAILAGRRVG